MFAAHSGKREIPIQSYAVAAAAYAHGVCYSDVTCCASRCSLHDKVHEAVRTDPVHDEVHAIGEAGTHTNP